MSLSGCVGHVGRGASDALLLSVQAAVRENDHAALTALLADADLAQLERKNVIHSAAWFGHPKCVRLLVDRGMTADRPHRKNGCTPLHLAHLCNVSATDAAVTIDLLIQSGASVNNSGGPECGHSPIWHAIQHQRLDAVTALLSHGCNVATSSLLTTIEIVNPEILEALLLSGGRSGPPNPSAQYWGPLLTRALHSPNKSPRQCYGQLVRLVVSATVCRPTLEFDKCPRAHVELELRSLGEEHPALAAHLLLVLLLSGFRPSRSLRALLRGGSRRVPLPAWSDRYELRAAPLRDLCVRALRSRLLHASANVRFALGQLNLPPNLRPLILLQDPLV